MRVGVGEIDLPLRHRWRRERLDHARRHAARAVGGHAARPPRLIGTVRAHLRPQLLIKAALGFLEALGAASRTRPRPPSALLFESALGLAQPGPPTLAGA